MQMSQLLAFAQFSHQRSLLALKYALPLCIAFAILFLTFPQLDLLASSVFFRPASLGYAPVASGFWLSQSVFLQWCYAAVDVLSRVALLLSIFMFVVFLIKKNAKVFNAAVVMLALIAGPTLAVNSGLKEHWGRARPRDIVQFNGQHQFSPAWIISKQCEHNCSFVTGHGAAGFAIVIGFFVSRRKAWLKSGLIVGGLVGLSRMMNGAHFLSDVIFSFFVVFIVAALVAYVVSRLTLIWVQSKPLYKVQN